MKINKYKNRVIPNWKDRLNDNPTHSQFLEAWRDEFNYPYERCVITNHFSNGKGFSVKTPTEHIHSGFYYDDTTTVPDLCQCDSESDIIYTGRGCGFNLDLDRNRYYLLVESTLLPYHLPKLKNVHIIKQYLSKDDTEMGTFIDRLLTEQRAMKL